MYFSWEASPLQLLIWSIRLLGPLLLGSLLLSPLLLNPLLLSPLPPNFLAEAGCQSG